ncbi:hypothetical protein B0A48_04760 [Cryoendolithus antarcticus]|uniref:Uncharacterized protein n=1 Tax=Cryoendolithus antarcticus TaxID=1507870 RepID=A0A1V8TDS7_9PEZI|nr:hypothetical protein B0A48_04760 [Cryoendolithus antarcticus]
MRLANSGAYYATNIFDFSALDRCAGSDLCIRWVRDHPPSVQAQIKHIRFIDSYNTIYPPLDCSALCCALQTAGNEASKHIKLGAVDSATYSTLRNWTYSQLLFMSMTGPGARLPGFVKVIGDWRYYMVVRAETKIRWFGVDGVQRETWVHLCCNDAETELVAAVKRTCRRLK